MSLLGKVMKRTLSLKELISFEQGAWAAFTHVLQYLNTLNDQNPSKTVVHTAVADMTLLDVSPTRSEETEEHDQP